ncbi:MAG TPA: patatin-like phospholipase family protein [Casimicrobiaceae bacterium]|nr:patatin-like phospholipase family protein [Casimicrobiaceae bacterium]
MSLTRPTLLLSLAMLLLLAGCATRPVNPPITQADPTTGYRYTTREQHFANKNSDNLVILAFSGGGTRAAAFSYGVLEALRRMEVVGPKGIKARLLDEVDIITGVSGGSFTALAFGLYGDKLFDVYETAFLKRNVQGELIGRVLNPGNWGALWSPGWGRSETAAQLYDEILFHGATYADLNRGSGPFVVATATDIATGTRIGFNQGVFDVMCSNLDAVPLSRAAAASSAVPFALSPVTINNYGGTCHFALPPFLSVYSDPATTPRPAARVVTQLHDLQSYEQGNKPYIHLVDGGLSDNLGLRGVLEALENVEALDFLGRPTPFDKVRRIVVFIVNSLSEPATNWDESERPPGDVTLLVKATGVPIDHYSYDAVESLRDMIANWQKMRTLRNSAAFRENKDPEIAALLRTPNIDLYAIEVSFTKVKDPAERAYLNDLPTSFVLPAEAVDRLRAAAGNVILESPDFQRLLKEAGARIVTESSAGPASASSAH